MIEAGVVLTLLAWLVIIGVAALILLTTLRRRKQERSAERQQGMAQIVSMEKHVQMGFKSHFVDTLHYATFRLEDGRELIFKISEAEYDRLMQGDTGELTWQGTRFLFFSRR